MYIERFLKGRGDVSLTDAERAAVDGAISKISEMPARAIVAKVDERITVSTLLVSGFMCRYIDDRNGLRQVVAIHVPGDFVDLHAYPLQRLDHYVATLSACTTAVVPHERITALIAGNPHLARKLWASTLLDASMHRAWLFRLGRLDAIGRVAHLLSELNVRLSMVGLGDGHRFALGITQADIAEACGLTTVHTNRVMRALREEKLCTFRSSVVDIADPAALARRGQFDAGYLYFS